VGESCAEMEEKMRNKLKNFKEFIFEEDGMGTVEVILIIVVLIGLVIVFKKQLQSVVTKAFKKITEDSNTVMS
jgi:Flp pilus assembly pilin Flp